MNKYSELSDFEVNRLVAERLGLKFYGDKPALGGIAPVALESGKVDFCNNWADAGPLMVDHQINLNLSDFDEKWTASAVYDEVDAMSDNPCLAIAECYLMMTECEE